MSNMPNIIDNTYPIIELNPNSESNTEVNTIVNDNVNNNTNDDMNIDVNLLDLIDVSHVTYNPGRIQNPFTKKYNNIIFADDVASGRPCCIVDSLIIQNVNPYYSNTHSNATCGI